MSYTNRNQFIAAFVIPCLILFVVAGTTNGQRLRVTKNLTFGAGEIRAIKPGEISIHFAAEDKTTTFKIQDKDETAISLEGKVVFRSPAEIGVTGTLPVKLLETGMIVEFNIPLNRRGKSESTVNQLKVIQGDDSDLKIEPESKPKDNEYVAAKVIGRVVEFKKNRLRLYVPKSKYASSNRAYFSVSPDAKMRIEQDSLNRVIPGDSVIGLNGVELSNGAKVVSKIDIDLTASRDKATLSFNDQLEQKFSGMSDEPGEPREVTSDHFILYTDVSDRSAAVLLSKLERMYRLIAKYFGKRPRQPIECYVVRPKNLGKWIGKLPDRGAKQIAGLAGVTISQSDGRKTVSTVYSCSDHGVVQHESVHAFCAMAFGTAGPVWYAEGMAEMGQYWQEGQREVRIDPVAIDYLSHAEPKRMRDIVAAGQITGDSWRAYAWRWALCHLLANNPNYASRFKQLGIAVMSKGPDSFDNAFGPIAPAISFEYDQFVQNFGNGYRVDLCVWDWKSKPRKLSKSAKTKVIVKAKAGWQATKVKVIKGTKYDFAAEGKWKTDAKTETDADGQDNGKLVAAIQYDFELSEPFDLGTRGSFTASQDGHLFVRCKDDWTDLSNNDGQITVHFRRNSDSAK